MKLLLLLFCPTSHDLLWCIVFRQSGVLGIPPRSIPEITNNRKAVRGISPKMQQSVFKVKNKQNFLFMKISYATRQGFHPSPGSFEQQ